MLDRNCLNIFDRGLVVGGVLTHVAAIACLALEASNVSFGTFFLLWSGPWAVGYAMGALAERKECQEEVNSDATN